MKKEFRVSSLRQEDKEEKFVLQRPVHNAFPYRSPSEKITEEYVLKEINKYFERRYKK